MRRRVCGVLGLLGLAFLVLGAYAPAQAAPPRLPSYTPFKTAHITSAVISELFGTQDVVIGYGDLDVPERVHFTQQYPDEPETADEIFIIGNALYQLDPLADVFDEIRGLPGVNGTQGLEPGIDPVIAAAITEVIELPNQTIDGVLCRHFRFIVDSKALLTAVDGLAPDQASVDALGAELEMWIGVADNVVRQQQQVIEFKDLSSDPPDVLRLIQVIGYSNINQPVTIVPPEIVPPPVPEVPPEGIAIYPPKYPLAGTSLGNMVRYLRQAAARN